MTAQQSRLVLVAFLIGICFIALGIGLLKFRDQAENANARANQLQADLDTADKQLAVFRARCTELEEKHVALVRAVEQARTGTQIAPPVLNSTRGKVTNIEGGLLSISIGIDSGLAVGTVLDVIRPESGKLLGTVKVTSALNLFPKVAIVSFTPARGVPLDRVPLEDLPKVGDLVRSPEALIDKSRRD